MTRLARARAVAGGPAVRVISLRAVAAVLATALLLTVSAGLGASPLVPPPAAATGTSPDHPPAEGPGTEGVGAQEGNARAGETPLAVTIDTLTPAAVPKRGRVTVTGTVTNRSASTWTDLNVYLLMSAAPIRSADELAEANTSDPAREVGARITDAGLYDRVRDLEPGESTGYLLSVPRRALPVGAEGVYWLGVHVLGSNEDGRVDGADGRARTFIPLIRGDEPRTTLSLVMPMKARVLRTRDGRLANPAGLERQVGEDGRLTRLLQLSNASAGLPLTWVVDPAVLNAVSSLAEGNPPFDTGPTGPGNGSGESPSPDSGPAGSDGETDEEVGEPSLEAAEWLENFVAQAENHAVMTVPYGDLDVASALRHGHDDLYESATRLSAATLEELGISSSPVVAPPDGRLPRAALEDLDSSATLVLDRRALEARGRLVRLREGQLLVRSSQVARLGGPGPTDPYDALALRQRILAEAAVEALRGDPLQPLVVPLPEDWDPGPDWRNAAFFAAMELPWVRGVNLPFATVLAPTGLHSGPLRYPRRLRRAELPPANLRAARELEEAGQVLAELLTRNETVDDQVGAAALLGASHHARERPGRAHRRVRRTTEAVREELHSVTVESSPLVTMSSETGNFSVTVVNGLEEPVTVGLSAQTGTTELEIRSPDLVSLGPGQRASVRLAVTAYDTGVHSVSIMPTTEDGRPLGNATRIKVRSSQVGLVIWLIIGVAAVVFAAAITLRVVRRVRKRRKTHGPVLKGVGV